MRSVYFYMIIGQLRTAARATAPHDGIVKRIQNKIRFVASECRKRCRGSKGASQTLFAKGGDSYGRRFFGSQRQANARHYCETTVTSHVRGQRRWWVVETPCQSNCQIGWHRRWKTAIRRTSKICNGEKLLCFDISAELRRPWHASSLISPNPAFA